MPALRHGTDRCGGSPIGAMVNRAATPMAPAVTRHAAVPPAPCHRVVAVESSFTSRWRAKARTKPKWRRPCSRATDLANSCDPGARDRRGWQPQRQLRRCRPRREEQGGNRRAGDDQHQPDQPKQSQTVRKLAANRRVSAARGSRPLGRHQRARHLGDHSATRRGQRLRPHRERGVGLGVDMPGEGAHDVQPEPARLPANPYRSAEAGACHRDWEVRDIPDRDPEEPGGVTRRW